MKIVTRCIRVVVLTSFIGASPSFAHHSFSADYNISLQITLKGEITSVEWMNPHVFVTLAVRDSEGAIQNWHVEGGAVNSLKQSGWTAEMLQQMVKSHDVVTVTGYRARKDSETDHGAWVKAIELPDGRKLSFN